MPKTNYPSDSLHKFMLRLSSEMRDRLKEAAEKNGRSMNSEIVARLENSLTKELLDTDELPSADKLAAASDAAFEDLQAALWSFAVKTLVEAAKAGKRNCIVDFEGVAEFEEDDEDHCELVQEILAELEKLSYESAQIDSHVISVKW